MATPYYTYGGNLLNREKFTSVVNTTFGTRRYFSSIDTDVYFGDVHIDEMVAFDFVIDEKKIPIFGYNNFTAKRLITGQKNIQGSFAINFTQTFNLKHIIDGLSESLYANKFEETQFYCGDDNKALFGKGFDITLSYGDAKGEGSYNSCTQTLVGCFITSYRQAFDVSGEPILDMYTFVAKDLIVSEQQSTVESEVKDEKDTSNVTDTRPEGPDSYFVGNELDSNEKGKAAKEFKEDKNKLCISIYPAYVFVDGTSKLTIRTLVHNNVDFNISSLTMTITDKAVKAGGYNYKLSKTSDNYYTYAMLGTQVTVGKSINDFFTKPGNKSLDCDIEIKCTAGGRSFSISKSTKLYDEETVRGG